MPLTDKIRKLLRRIRIFGWTFKQTADTNLKNTKRALLSAFDQAVNNDYTPAEMSQSLRKTARRRIRQTITTIRNTLTRGRSDFRGQMNRGCQDWLHTSILDASTTRKCRRMSGQRHLGPYSTIPDADIPPRTAADTPVHPCRGMVLPQCGRTQLQQKTFKDFLNSESDEVRKYLGPRRYRMWERGDLPIESFADLSRGRLFTLDELHEKGIK